MARPDFRSTAARRLAEERELSPAVLSLISPEGTERPRGVRNIPLDRIAPNPDQPRMTFDEDALAELAASITEHGVLHPGFDPLDHVLIVDVAVHRGLVLPHERDHPIGLSAHGLRRDRGIIGCRRP